MGVKPNEFEPIEWQKNHTWSGLTEQTHTTARAIRLLSSNTTSHDNDPEAVYGDVSIESAICFAPRVFYAILLYVTGGNMGRQKYGFRNYDARASVG